MTAKVVCTAAIDQRPAIRLLTSRSARLRDSAPKLSASAADRPIVLESRIPETLSDSCTSEEMSAIADCRVADSSRRRSPTLRYTQTKIGSTAKLNSARRQSSANMAIVTAITVVTLDVMEVAVEVTTVCTPPMSLAMRDWTSPVLVRVKNARLSRWRCRYTAERRSCMTCWPTLFDRYVW